MVGGPTAGTCNSGTPKRMREGGKTVQLAKTGLMVTTQANASARRREHRTTSEGSSIGTNRKQMPLRKCDKEGRLYD